MATELTADQVNQINTFTSTTVGDNEEWDDLIQRLTSLVDTPQGRNFVFAALSSLTIEVQEGDLHSNVENLAAAIALHMIDGHAFTTDKFPRIRNKTAILNAILEAASFNILLDDEDGNGKICSKCQRANLDLAQFCITCGTKFPVEPANGNNQHGAQNAPANNQPEAQHAPPMADLLTVCTSMNACATAMQKVMEHSNKMQQQMAQAIKAQRRSHVSEDSNSDSDSEEHHGKSIPLWLEPPLSRQQCAQVKAQYDYPLNSFLKRAITNVSKALVIIKANKGTKLQEDDFNQVTLMLSTSIRDLEEELLQPGLKPAQQDAEALATSLLSARYSKATIKEKCAPKKRQQYPPATTPSPWGPPTPQPHVEPRPSTAQPTKAPKPFWRPKGPPNSAASQTDP